METVVKSRWQRASVNVVLAIGTVIALSGCVVEPLWGPHYHRPYYGYYGRY
jgi:hypothetical protein